MLFFGSYTTTTTVYLPHQPGLSPSLSTPAPRPPPPDGRRCCTLEFHPTHDSIVVSGDKKGGLAVWNFDQVRQGRAGAHVRAYEGRRPSPSVCV